MQDEIAKRKAAIEEARKAKGSAGGSLVAAALGAGVLGGLVTGVVAYLRASRAHPGNGWNGFTALKAAAVGAAVAGLLGGAAALLLPAAVLQSLGLLLSAVAASGVAQVLGLAVASATVAGIVSLLRAERSSPGNGWNGFRAAKAAVIAGGAGLALGLLLVVLL
ncbi:MAG: hypothetical protein HYX59_03795 [Elusimicrobia bacterium]|nr:hypothetical protein [Elusimicrobiota bacterium]